MKPALLLWWCLSTPLLGEYAPALQGPFADEAACEAWRTEQRGARVTTACWRWSEEASA